MVKLLFVSFAPATLNGRSCFRPDDWKDSEIKDLLWLDHPDILLLHERLAGWKRKSWPLQPLEGGRIPYGRQHNTLVSIAGTLRARRVCDEAIEACLQIVNERQCERPGPRVHISQLVHSSRKWGTA